MNPVECCRLCEPVKAASQQVPSYRLWVCEECWQNAENGWAKDAEPVLFAALASAGLLIPDRNEQVITSSLCSAQRLCAVTQLTAVSRNTTDASLGAIKLMN